MVQFKVHFLSQYYINVKYIVDVAYYNNSIIIIMHYYGAVQSIYISCHTRIYHGLCDKNVQSCTCTFLVLLVHALSKAVELNQSVS